MKKLIVLSFMTLDGVVQAPGGPEEDPTGGFKYGGWTVFYWDDILGAVMDEQMEGPFDLLLGRKTYEIFASRKLQKLDWNNSVLIQGEVIEEIKRLKQEDGPQLHIHGSSNLIQTLLKNDLIDEFRLKIFPLTLGTGKRLFGEGTIPAAFRLTESRRGDENAEDHSKSMV